jgi:hypothetical protein
MARSKVIELQFSGDERFTPAGLEARLTLTPQAPAPGPTPLHAAAGCRTANFFKGPEPTRAIPESHGIDP